MWNKTGSATVTQGSTILTGDGTDWQDQRAGWEFVLAGEDRRHEIKRIISATALELQEPVERASASGLAFVIIPTQGLNLVVRQKIDDVLAIFRGVLDNFALGVFALWQAQGGNEQGTIADFLSSMIGPQGPQGIEGTQGFQGPQGVKGDQGIQGAIGPQGLQGSQGLQGDVGPQGPLGPQGVEGPQGEQGPQGEIGPEGAAGPQGPQGLIGMQGDTGPQGVQGIQGPQGPQGAKGDQGAGLIIKGNVLNTASLPVSGNTEGDAYSIGASSPRDIYVWDADLPDWVNHGPLEGPQGMEGPAGPPGVDGAAGLQGAPGPQGEAGPAGPEGPQGLQGVQGAIGPQGLQGTVGPSGPQGPAGAAGIDGAEGPSGPQGPVGADGAQGPVGPAGADITEATNAVFLGSASFRAITETHTGLTGGAPSLNLELGNVFSLNTTTNTTVTVANPPAGKGWCATLHVTLGGAHALTIAGADWGDDGAPTDLASGDQVKIALDGRGAAFEAFVAWRKTA